MQRRFCIMAAVITLLVGCGNERNGYHASQTVPASRETAVTMGRPGDHWVDTMQFVRVARAQRGSLYGYEVTYEGPGSTTFTLFWSRDQIDLRGTLPSYRLENMRLGDGRLLYPDRLTEQSLPKVFQAIQLIEEGYGGDADGAITAAELFGVVAALGSVAPAPRATGPTRPSSKRAPPSHARGSKGANAGAAPKLLPALSQTTQDRFLASATQQVSRGGVTAVGRAIQKHAARPGSFFEDGRNAAESARIGAELIRSLLSNSASTVTVTTHKVFGPIVKIRLPNGAGAQFKQSGEFIGLLEPFAR